MTAKLVDSLSIVFDLSLIEAVLYEWYL